MSIKNKEKYQTKIAKEGNDLCGTNNIEMNKERLGNIMRLENGIKMTEENLKNIEASIKINELVRDSTIMASKDPEIKKIWPVVEKLTKLQEDKNTLEEVLKKFSKQLEQLKVRSSIENSQSAEIKKLKNETREGKATIELLKEENNALREALQLRGISAEVLKALEQSIERQIVKLIELQNEIDKKNKTDNNKGTQ